MIALLTAALVAFVSQAHAQAEPKDLQFTNVAPPNDPTKRAPVSTPGQPCSPQDVHDAAVESVAAAESAGWTSVGGLPLSKIKSAIEKTPVDIKCVTNEVKFTQGRSSARFDANGKNRTIEVYQATAWPKIDRETQRVLSLHEHLGALGFQDDTYQMSLRIGLMPAFKPSSANPLDKTPKPLQMPKDLKKKGGSTVVGGGGDGGELGLRAGIIAGMTSSLDRLDPNSQQFRRTLVLFDDILRVHVVFDPEGADAPVIFQEAGRDVPSVKLGTGYYEGRDTDATDRELIQAIMNAANRAYEKVRATIP